MALRKKTEVQWPKYVVIAFCLWCGSKLGIFIGQELAWMYIYKGASWGVLYLETIAVIFASCYFQVVFHEIGHLMFGLLTGYRFSYIRIGSVILIKGRTGYCVRRVSVPGTGGECLLDPPELKDGRMPVALCVLGGCIMNFVVSGLCLAGFLICERGNLWSIFLLSMVAFGAISGLSNAIPMRTRFIDNDGKIAYTLWKNPDAMRIRWVLMKVVQRLAQGDRFRDMPEAWFAMPAEEEIVSGGAASLAYYTCNRLMDEKRFQEADACIAALLQIDGTMRGVQRNRLICDRIYMELIGENREVTLSVLKATLQRQYMKYMRRNASVLRTQYAYQLLAEGDRIGADRIKDTFERLARVSPYSGLIQSERELMELADQLATR